MSRPRRLRLGMVGGGEGAFIGGVHRLAARLDDEYELVAAAPSSDPARALRSSLDLRLAPERIYTDFREMARAEAAREDGIDVVAIVVPNHLHFAVAQAHHCLFALTHNYSGYPLVRAARDMVASGTLGELRVVQVEYAHAPPGAGHGRPARLGDRGHAHTHRPPGRLHRGLRADLPRLRRRRAAAPARQWGVGAAGLSRRPLRGAIHQ